MLVPKCLPIDVYGDLVITFTGHLPATVVSSRSAASESL